MLKKPRKFGMKIKNDILEHEKLTCSVGIGPNKLIAKMASSFRKPDGLTLVERENVIAFLSPMPVKKLWGIGKVTEEKLLQMGIETIGQLSTHDVLELIAAFWQEQRQLAKTGSFWY